MNSGASGLNSGAPATVLICSFMDASERSAVNARRHRSRDRCLQPTLGVHGKLGTGVGRAYTRNGRAANPHSLFSVNPLAALVAFLRLDRQGGNGTRFQAFERDRLAGLLAIAVGPVLDARQRRIDLGDQL